MKLEIKNNIDKFKGILKVVNEVNNESMLTLTPTGIVLRIIDPTQAMLLDISIKKEFFDVYDVDKEISFNIDFGIMLKIVNSMKKGFIMEDKDSELEFTTKGLVRSIKKYVAFREEKKELKFDYENSCSMDMEEFISAVQLSLEVSTVGELVMKDTLNIKTEGHIEKMNIDISGKYSVEQKGFFSLDYIAKLNGLVDVFDNINFKLKNDLPLCLEGSSEFVTMGMLLAPRMGGTD